MRGQWWKETILEQWNTLSTFIICKYAFNRGSITFDEVHGGKYGLLKDETNMPGVQLMKRRAQDSTEEGINVKNMIAEYQQLELSLTPWDYYLHVSMNFNVKVVLKIQAATSAGPGKSWGLISDIQFTSFDYGI